MTFTPVVPAWLLAVVSVIGLAVVLPRPSTGIGALTVVRRALVVALLTMVLAGPALARTENRPTQHLDVDVLVMLDTSVSMNAEDAEDAPTRLAEARRDAARLAEQLPGARLALLTFDQQARIDVPFTTDGSAFVSAVQVAAPPADYYAQGTSVSAGVQVARRYLAAASRQHASSPTIVVYLGDGEQTAPGHPASFAPLAPYSDASIVVGYGTEHGGPMRQSDPYLPEDPYITDPTDPGRRALSHLDPRTLRAIARQLDGDYSTSLEVPATRLVAAATKAADVGTPSSETPVTWLAASLLCVLLVGELASLVRLEPWRAP